MKALLCLLPLTAFAALDFERDVWFYADFENPVQIAGASAPVDFPPSTNDVVEGKFGKGYHFHMRADGKYNAFADGDRRNGNCYNTTDWKIVQSFPWDDGTFLTWVKCDTDEAVAKKDVELFGCSRWWQSQYSLSNLLLKTADKGGLSGIAPTKKGEKKRPFFPRENRWRHVAATWNRDVAAVYVDGVLVATNRPVAVGVVSNAIFRIGSTLQARGTAEAVMDDVAILKRTLSADEIAAIAQAETPLFTGCVLAQNPPFPYFWRNQENAALRFDATLPEAGEWTFQLTVDGQTQPPVVIRGEKGVNAITLPFEPVRWRPGNYGWNYTVSFNGERRLEKSGELTIYGRLDRDGPKFHEWGAPHNAATRAFYKEIGLNSFYVHHPTALARAREIIESGAYLDIRYGNSGYRHSWDKHEADIRKTFAPYVGLHAWTETLVNTEVYGLTEYTSLTNPACKAYHDRAVKELGFEPVVAERHHPCTVDWKKAGYEKPLRGVIDPKDYPAFQTIAWAAWSGHPTLWLDGENRRIIHELNPGCCVWSEPSYGALAAQLDMFADWQYRHSAHETLWEMRSNAARVRQFGTKYMCTLTPEYCHGCPGKFTKPGNQTADEFMVKSMLAITATPAWNVGIWATGAWVDEKRVTEPETGKKIGAYVRTKMLPALQLLRGIDTVRAPIGFMHNVASSLAGDHGWNHHHYGCALRTYLSHRPVPFDEIGGGAEKRGENLAKYKYLFVPLANVITKEEDAAFKYAAERGTKIVFDAESCVEYPGSIVQPPKTVYNHYTQNQWRKEMKEWRTPMWEDLRAGLKAVSEQDGENAFTNVKEHNGVTYVGVVNYAREENRGDRLLTAINTNANYRPYSAPQTITTVIRDVGAKAAVYEYNAPSQGPKGPKGLKRQAVDSKGDTRHSNFTITAEYAPAEGKIFCVYPEALEAPEIEYSKNDGRGGRLTVTIATVSGRSAPGRTVVELKLADPEGRVTDESGFYTVENGRVEIPVRFADGDPAGGLFFSKWRAEVRDLTTGETGECRFRR